jgi:Meckel syndrome type 1 protein
MSGSKEKFERDFESFLSDDDSRLAALYRKLPQAEPDARLDAAVQAMARRAAAATPAATRIPTRRRWLPALGAAAVVALAAGIAFQIGPQMWQRPTRPPAAKSMTVPAAAPPAAPQPAKTAPVAQKAAAADSAGTAAPAPRAPSAELQKTENAASRPAPRAFPAPAQAMQEAASPPPPATEPKATFPAATSAAPQRARQAGAESAGAPAATLAAPATQDRNASLYPEHWLANIRQMLRANQREAALRSLENFRKTYPDYRLPDDLRDLR